MYPQKRNDAARLHKYKAKSWLLVLPAVTRLQFVDALLPSTPPLSLPSPSCLFPPLPLLVKPSMKPSMPFTWYRWLAQEMASS